MIGKDDVFSWIKALQAVYAENRQYLTDLDAAIGDADHGINMDRGFTRIVTDLNPNETQDIGELLKSVAMILIKTVGGAAGPLYGTFFLRAGEISAGKRSLDAADVVSMLEAGLKGVVQRGRADLKDKTMVDALTPALDRMNELLANKKELAEILKQGANAARLGMEETIPLQAKKGRASYLGERSIGHQDPGATSAYLLLKTMARVFENG